MADDTPTRPNSSGSIPVFADVCRELIAKLGAVVLDDEGKELSHEAANLLTAFQAWALKPPPPEHRAEAVDRALTLHRRVRAYLARRAGVVGSGP